MALRLMELGGLEPPTSCVRFMNGGSNRHHHAGFEPRGTPRCPLVGGGTCQSLAKARAASAALSKSGAAAGSAPSPVEQLVGALGVEQVDVAALGDHARLVPHKACEDGRG